MFLRCWHNFHVEKFFLLICAKVTYFQLDDSTELIIIFVNSHLTCFEKTVIKMHITEKKYYTNYHKLIGYKIPDLLQRYNFNAPMPDIGYTTRTFAVYSANIEGNPLDLNSYMNFKLVEQKFKPQKEVAEIDNLVQAYQYAQSHDLNEPAFLKCHTLFSKTLLIKSKRGRYRDEKVGIFSAKGLVYLAIEPEYVAGKMRELYNGIEQLLNSKLDAAEVFYHAALLHLLFVHIHPFMDGNGRGARLLEKWFIAQLLGKHLWNLSSEQYYKDHRDEYYENIHLGVNYYELDYDLCLPFLSMLPNCLA